MTNQQRVARRRSVIAHVAERLDAFAAVVEVRPIEEYKSLLKEHAERIVDAVLALMKGGGK